MRLSEIKNLKEASLETKTIEDLWQENSSNAAEYSSIMTYLVRPIKDTSPTQYEAFSVQGDTRKPFGKYDAVSLGKILAPIRPNQTPDAEGYTTYVDLNKTSAFQYQGDPILVSNDGDDVQLNNGDYVTRVVKGKSFTYNIEDQSDFEAELKKA